MGSSWPCAGAKPWLLCVAPLLLFYVSGCADVQLGQSRQADTFQLVFADSLTTAIPSGRLRSVAAAAERDLKAFQRNSLVAFGPFVSGTKYLFMPNPGRPRLGSRSGFTVAGVEAAYVDLYLSEGHSAVLSVDGVHAFIISATQAETISPAEDTAGGNVLPHDSGWASINVFREGRRIQACVNLNCRTVLSSATALSAQVSGDAAIVSNAQAYVAGNWRSVPLADVEQIPGEAGARGSVIAWERLAQETLRASWLLADTLAICTEQPRALWPRSCPDFARRAFEFSRRSLATLSRWPSWRPFDARLDTGSLLQSRSLTTWDRGNWANGFFPAAFAVLVTIAGAEAGSDEDLAAFRRVWKKQGLEFVLSESFPSTAHWIRRSTNHAAIIYGNLIGADLLMNHCRESASVARMLGDLKRIAEASVRNGLYAESVSYGEVFFIQSMFGAFMLSACRGQPPAAAFEAFYGDTLRDFALRSSALTFPSGYRWLHYGDSSNFRWRGDMAAMMAIYEPSWDEVSAWEPFYGNAAVRLQGLERSSGINRPAPGRRDTSTFRCDVSEDAGVALIRSRVDGTSIDLGVVSTPVHLTHNKDWDLGAMTLRIGDGLVIGEHRDELDRSITRAGHSHSTAWIEPAEAQSCFDSESRDLCVGRRINGKVELLSSRASACRFAARGNDYRAQHRVFDVRADDSGFAVTVFDVADLSAGQRLVVNLNVAPAWLERAALRDSGHADEALDFRISPLRGPEEAGFAVPPRRQPSAGPLRIDRTELMVEGQLIAVSRMTIGARDACGDRRAYSAERRGDTVRTVDNCNRVQSVPVDELLTRP